MKILLILIFVWNGVFAGPEAACLGFYSGGKSEKRIFNHDQFRSNSYKRLIGIFRSKWFRQNEHHDVTSAKIIVEKLEKYGSPVDYAIFDTYLKVLENTTGFFDLRNTGFYYDMWEAYRPKSNHFQQIQWDWSIFSSYLFDNTRSVMLPRKWDLEYLTFVKDTAIRMGSDKTLKAVLEQADHDWARIILQHDPKISKQYTEFKNGRSQSQIHKRFNQKVNNWINEAKTEDGKKQRTTASHTALLSFRSATSAFDLMLMEKYFDLVVKYGVENRKGDTYDMVPKWIHLNAPLAVELGLSYGSLHYMTDFIFQNAYNLKIKTQVLEVLNLMEKNPVKSEYDVIDFSMDFHQAYFEHLDQVKKSKAPENYKTDLHIYARSMNPKEATVDSLEHTVVKWNDVLGQVQVNTLETYPVARNQMTTVESHPELRTYVTEYFKQFRDKKTFSEIEINRDEAAELNALLLNSTFFVFTPSEKSQLLSMARLFDGTQTKTYIEEEFKNVEIPERKTGENIFEIGRLLSRPEVESESLELILARIAEHLYTKKISGMIYFDVKKEIRSIYKRKYKAEDVYTPEQLNLAPGATPLWIMKMSVEKFIESFYKSEFQSVKLRANRLITGDDSKTMIDD